MRAARTAVESARAARSRWPAAAWLAPCGRAAVALVDEEKRPAGLVSILACFDHTAFSNRIARDSRASLNWKASTTKPTMAVNASLSEARRRRVASDPPRFCLREARVGDADDGQVQPSIAPTAPGSRGQAAARRFEVNSGRGARVHLHRSQAAARRYGQRAALLQAAVRTHDAREGAE